MDETNAEFYSVIDEPSMKEHSVPELQELDKKDAIRMPPPSIQSQIQVPHLAKAARHVDRFFDELGMPSPIKARCIQTDMDPKNELPMMSYETDSLDLRLTDITYEMPLAPNGCIQPDRSSNLASLNALEMTSVDSGKNKSSDFETPKDDTLNSIKETNNNKIEKEIDINQHPAGIDKDSHLSRKRSQQFMEPAVFEVPRASKVLHKDSPPVPEFIEDSAPLINFGGQRDGVFQSCVQFNGNALSQQDEEEEMSVQENTNGVQNLTFTIDDQKSQKENLTRTEEKGGDEQITTDELQKSNPPQLDKTIDMTIRSSGGSAFAWGVFLAIDEILDPALGAILPYGIRRRGVNLAVAGTMVGLAIAARLYFMG